MSYTLAMSPFLESLLGDEDVNEIFAAESDIAAIFAFEVELAKAQEKCGVIPKGVAKNLKAALQRLNPDPELFGKSIARDGVLVPVLVEMIKAAMKPEYAEHVHKFATSQDAIDTSLMMRLVSAFHVIQRQVLAIHERMKVLDKTFGKRTLIGRTRMQQALPIKVSVRLTAWQNNLGAASIDLALVEFPLQLFGPTGTYQDQNVRDAMAKALGLLSPLRSWQNERSPILKFGNVSAGLTGALGKIGADIALMAQNELAEIKLTGGGTSSAMAHKQNPVKAEVLVSLARFNASLISGLHNAAVHEQERSGSAWTLEWLILPQMICAAAGSARVARELLESVESIGT